MNTIVNATLELIGRVLCYSEMGRRFRITKARACGLDRQTRGVCDRCVTGRYLMDIVELEPADPAARASIQVGNKYHDICADPQIWSWLK